MIFVVLCGKLSIRPAKIIEPIRKWEEINQSIDQSNAYTLKRPVNQSINQSINRLSKQVCFAEFSNPRFRSFSWKFPYSSGTKVSSETATSNVGVEFDKATEE